MDAGVIYWGYTNLSSPGTLLGATKGGAVYTIDRKFRDTRPDGSKGPVKGFRRLESVDVSLECELMEVTEANLLILLAGSAAADHVITGAEIDDNDYRDIALLVQHSGFDPTTAPMVCKLSNALVEGALTINPKPNDEGTIKVKFVAHYADTDLATEPWEITYPS
jgi:hypothetical protein